MDLIDEYQSLRFLLIADPSIFVNNINQINYKTSNVIENSRLASNRQNCQGEDPRPHQKDQPQEQAIAEPHQESHRAFLNVRLGHIHRNQRP